MMKSLLPSRWSLLALLCAMTLHAHAQNNPDIPTSDNDKIMVLPAPGEVVIDGDDKDWDLSAGIWSYNDPTLVKKYSAWTHLMWDEKGVYLLGRYYDPSPMKNATRGKDFQSSWRADAMQARVVLDDKTPDEHQMHINLFYSSTEEKPYMIVHHGGFKKEPPYDGTGPFRQDQNDKYGVTMDASGGKIAFKPWTDGKGYNMEVFWPWSYLRTNGQPLKAGESFVIGIEEMWGSVEGTELAHRLVDNLKNDKVNRIFFFRAKDGWGEAILKDKGNLTGTEDQKKLQAERLKQFVNYDTTGTVPITYTLDEDRDVTIAIDDSKGNRVRNLIGQYPRSKGKNTDFWDGLNDQGAPVEPGTYTARIVDHEPIEVKFVNSLYNAATPPWITATGRKLWGANHGHPTSAATRGDITLLGFTGTEGSSGIMRVEPDGNILWTDTTESLDLTLTDKYAYLLSRESWTKRTLIRRYDLQTGAIVLFDNPERSTETVLPVDVKEVPDAASFAYAHGKLFAFVPGKNLFRVDPNSGAVEATLTVPDLVAVTDRDDALWGLFADGSVAKLDAEGKKGSVALTVKDLKEPVRLAVSQDGKRFAISVRGTNQVMVYDADGKLVGTIGQPFQSVDGMRPAGKYVETDLIRPLGLDFDPQGRLWVAEGAGSNRRVTLWNPDGKLARQFWGGADYGAMAGFPLMHDSSRFIAHGVEFQLDPTPDLPNKPTNEKPLMFHPALADTRGVVYQYKGHEYAVSVPGMNKQEFVTIAKRNKDGIFQPVVRIDYGDKKKPGGVWTDLNENGKEDAGETVAGFQGTRHYWSTGWMRPDMTFITPDQLVYRVKEFTAGGVPVYDFQNPEKLPNNFKPDFRANSVGTIVMDDAGNISDGINFATTDGRKGSYPNPYGRHDAPAAKRGLLIAPFRTNGVVEKVPGVGSLTAIGGDRGEWFLMSMDGIYLSNILQDSKGDVILDDTFVGQESFGGFIWRDEKGRVLVQLGGPSYRIMEVKGLDTVRQATEKINVTAAQIAEGEKVAQARRDASPKEAGQLKIARVKQLPTQPAAPDTTETLIPGAETVKVQETGDASRWFRVALAQDGKNLAIAYQVHDSSPWKNAEGRFTHAFIGGDAVDVQLKLPNLGLVRILAAPLGGKDTVVFWQQKAAKKENATTYVVSNNEANAQNFDIVKRLESATVTVKTGPGGYSALLTVPLDQLGLDLDKVDVLKGVVGVIFSDPSGTNRTARLYWHDKTTGMVSDVPTESRLTPTNWGDITISK